MGEAACWISDDKVKYVWVFALECLIPKIIVEAFLVLMLFLEVSAAAGRALRT